MGYYIEVPEPKNKANQLIKLYEAYITERPDKLKEIPEDKALICVLQNVNFDAAGFCYNQKELDVFKVDWGFAGRQRPRTWLLMDLALVKKLTGFPT